MSALRPRFANPIFDAAFKHLMADTEVAKQVIGRFLGCKIDKIELRPQEVAMLKVELEESEVERLFSLLRMDYAAEIWDQREGASKQRKRSVLIEVQKGRLQDVRRFRGYLGARYQAKNEDGKLPIICIYLLGYITDNRLPQVTRVNRVLINGLTHEPILLPPERPDVLLVERLTHDAVFVQLEKPEPSERVVERDLQRMLVVFDQSQQSKDSPLLIEVGDKVEAACKADPLVASMVRILQAAACDQQTLRNMQAEEELQEAIDEIQDERDEAEAELQAAHRATEEAQRAAEHERSAKEAALAANREAEATIARLAERLKQLGLEP